jgi:hypothetical protein
MMDQTYYRNRFNEKMYDYWRAGYVQGINIFYTFDLPNGAVALRPVEDVIRNAVRSS